MWSARQKVRRHRPPQAQRILRSGYCAARIRCEVVDGVALGSRADTVSCVRRDSAGDGICLYTSKPAAWHAAVRA
eukprot:1851567-Prymnesium_polylepis.1